MSAEPAHKKARPERQPSLLQGLFASFARDALEERSLWSDRASDVRSQLEADLALARSLDARERERADRLRRQEEEDAALARSLADPDAQTRSDSQLARELAAEVESGFEERLRRDSEQVREDERLARELAGEAPAAAPSRAPDDDEALARALQEQEDEEFARISAADVAVAKRPRSPPHPVVPADHDAPALARALDGTPISVVAVRNALRAMCESAEGWRLRLAVNVALKDRFVDAYYMLASSRGAGKEGLCMAYHGTGSDARESIMEKGLVVPGTHGVEHRTDEGFYGRGIYVSPDVDTALGYGEAGVVFLCAVLRGRVYTCEEEIHGAGLMPGYDSHECDAEWVIFSEAHVLPIYACIFDEETSEEQ
eukprot:m51a1_g4199 hypothetical protein (370) ;mRNA; r:7163-8423